MQVSIQTAIDAVMDRLLEEDYSEGSLFEYRKAFQRLIDFAKKAGTDEYSVQIGTAFSASTMSLIIALRMERCSADENQAANIV